MRAVRKGATAAWIAQRTGVAERTVRAVLSRERTHLYAGTAAALLALEGRPGPASRRVDPEATIERLDDMIARHWPVHVIADMAGLSTSTLMPSNLRSGVTEQTQLAVRTVHERLAGRDGPAPRPYPWLAERLAAHRPVDIIRGTCLSKATVRRALHAQPLARPTALALSTWLNTQRLADLPELAPTG